MSEREVERVARTLEQAEIEHFRKCVPAPHNVFTHMARAIVADTAATLKAYEADHLSGCEFLQWEIRLSVEEPDELDTEEPPACTCGLAEKLAP